MKKVNVLYEYEYHDVDIICVPDDVANNIENVVCIFQRWMSDKRNKHDFWITNAGLPVLAITSEAFIWWLNTHHITTSEKAYIVNQHVSFCENYPTADF